MEVEGAQTWIHPGTGLVATSTVSDAGNCLALGFLDGSRCSAALVFLALADFDLLDASEDESLRGPERVFRLAVQG